LISGSELFEEKLIPFESLQSSLSTNAISETAEWRISATTHTGAAQGDRPAEFLQLEQVRN
jgi:hypothetical protein